MSIVYVVAASQKEAELLVEYGRETKAEAEAHLEECRKPPTDSFYGNQLHVYRVKVMEKN